eukprot:COSAG04_NODE_428_length_14528_cov_24.451036_5_plen_236_part_00
MDGIATGMGAAESTGSAKPGRAAAQARLRLEAAAAGRLEPRPSEPCQSLPVNQMARAGSAAGRSASANYSVPHSTPFSGKKVHKNRSGGSSDVGRTTAPTHRATTHLSKKLHSISLPDRSCAACSALHPVRRCAMEWPELKRKHDGADGTSPLGRAKVARVGGGAAPRRAAGRAARPAAPRRAAGRAARPAAPRPAAGPAARPAVRPAAGRTAGRAAGPAPRCRPAARRAAGPAP